MRGYEMALHYDPATVRILIDGRDLEHGKAYPAQVGSVKVSKPRGRAQASVTVRLTLRDVNKCDAPRVATDFRVLAPEVVPCNPAPDHDLVNWVRAHFGPYITSRHKVFQGEATNRSPAWPAHAPVIWPWPAPGARVSEPPHLSWCLPRALPRPPRVPREGRALTTTEPPPRGRVSRTPRDVCTVCGEKYDRGCLC